MDLARHHSSFVNAFGMSRRKVRIYNSYVTLITILLRVFDAVQKEFRKIVGKDFEWKTSWLDLVTERLLFYDYRKWAQVQKNNEELSETQRVLYWGLEDNLFIGSM